MRLAVVPGWFKVLFLFAIASGLGWWSWSSFRPADVTDPTAIYSRQRFNPEAGLPAQAQSNVQQLFVNPLEQANPAPKVESDILRDGGRNYYKDE